MRQHWEFIANRLVGTQGGRAYSSLLVAAAVHVGVFAVLAQWIRHHETWLPPIVSTAWTTVDDELPDAELSKVQDELQNQVSILAGGANNGHIFHARRVTSAVTPQVSPRLGQVFSSAMQDSIPDSLNEAVSGTDSAGASGKGGTGQGDGSGNGDPNGFFGVPVLGQRIVFVVDCSKSMNHPHDSDAKTRFRRLKLEILKSIQTMSPEMEFFIIFFNDQAHPMPAVSLQRAMPSTKIHYLNWMTKIKAIGETDPRRAIGMALRLNPDIVYFLTDGSFHRAIQADLLKLRSPKTSIHTFTFGDREGEETMKLIANNNNGQYHFIP